MAIRIEIHDGSIPMLEEIIEINYGMALDALDHAGIILRESTRKAFLASRTNWRQSYIKGELKIFKTSSSNVLGKRMSHVGKTSSGSPDNMKSFITSNLMTKSLTMVVGGKHGKLRPKLRKDGKVVGFARPVGAVTKGSYAILQKLNSGDVDTDNNDYNSKVRPSVDMRKFRNPSYKKQNFIERGRANAMGQVRSIMTDKLEKLIQKKIDRTNVTSRKVKTA